MPSGRATHRYGKDTNKGVLLADKTIAYKPETSVLKFRVGDEIRISEARFTLLFEAFSAEIKRKLAEGPRG